MARMTDTSYLVEELKHLIPRYSSDQSIIDAAATAMTAKDREIEALRADLERYASVAMKEGGMRTVWQARVETAERERDEARAALKPFVDDSWIQLTLDEVRALRAAARADIKQGE